MDTNETMNPDENGACIKNSGLTVAAVVQMPLHGFGDSRGTGEIVAKNAERAAQAVEHLIDAAGVTPQIIVLPVLCLTGIGAALQELGITPRIDREAIAVNLSDDPRLEPLRKLCAHYRCYIASSCVEKIGSFPGRYFHAGFVLGPSGLVLRSPKTQAPTSAGITLLKDFHKEYTEHFGTDAVLPVAETPLGKLGCLVETEFLIPEATRVLRRKGAEIILHPTAQHAGPGYPPYQAIRQSLAYTHGVYWLSAVPSREISKVQGKTHQTWFGGGSSIIGPDGAVIACIPGKHKGWVTGNIDLDFLRACRAKQNRYTDADPIIHQTR